MQPMQNARKKMQLMQNVEKHATGAKRGKIDHGQVTIG